MKKRFIALVMGFVLVITSVFPIFASENHEIMDTLTGTEDEEIIIEDDIVRAAVKEELGLDENEIITKNNTSGLLFLEINRPGAKSLNGLELLENIYSIEVHDGYISDLTCFENSNSAWSNISLYLYNNTSDSSDFIADYEADNLDVILSGNGSTINDAIRKYYYINPVELVAGEGSDKVYVEGNITLDNLRLVDYTGEIKINSSDESVGTLNVNKNAFSQSRWFVASVDGKVGHAAITVTFDNIVKETEISVTECEKEISIDKYVDNLPLLSEEMLLHNGSVWDFSGYEPTEYISNKNIKNYVSRKVYYEESKLGGYWTSYRYEDALVDENDDLFYIGKKSEEEMDEMIKVDSNVKVLLSYGYLDDNNTFHLWDWEDPTGGLPKESTTIEGVQSIEGNNFIMQDGSIYYYRNLWRMPGFVKVPTKIQHDGGADCLLDENDILWKVISPEDRDGSIDLPYTIEKIDDNVSKLEVDRYLKDGVVYSTYWGEVLLENVQDMIDLYYYVIDDSLYYMYSGDASLLCENFAPIDREYGGYYLTDDGNLWNLSFDQYESIDELGYKCIVLTSVEYTFDKYAVRSDGSVWKLNGASQPVKVLDSYENASDEMIFNDINVDDWYFKSVNYVYKKGIMTGLSNDTFGPIESLSRAQFAVMLHRLEGKPVVIWEDKFPDVASDTWYTDAVLWASQNGIITGYANGYFGPADNITREQMATIMYRYAKYKGYDITGSKPIAEFVDGSTVSSFATEAMSWTAGTGIITGKDNGTRLAPQENAARAECATIFMRFMEKY